MSDGFQVNDNFLIQKYANSSQGQIVKFHPEFKNFCSLLRAVYYVTSFLFSFGANRQTDRHTDTTKAIPASHSRAGEQVTVLLPTNMTAQVHSWEAIRRLRYSNKAALHSFADQTIVARSTKRKNAAASIRYSYK